GRRHPARPSAGPVTTGMGLRPSWQPSSSPRAAGTSPSTSQPLHDPYEIASCSSAPANRHDHRIMAGYPVQRGHSPAITLEAASRCLRDSGTLSGTSAEEEQMTGKIMPLRERDTSTVQAAADAFLSSPRYANPNTRRGYTGVLDRLLAGLGGSRSLAEVSGGGTGQPAGAAVGAVRPGDLEPQPRGR